MSTGPSTSRVFAAAKAWRDALRDATWPAGVTGADPNVGLADIDLESVGEFVQVVPVVGEDGSIAWRSLPGRRDESFSLTARILTSVGDTEDGTIDRLECLADVVQRSVYDDTATTTEAALIALLDGQIKNASPSEVAFRISSHGQEFAGYCEVVVPVTFYI